MRHFLVVFLLSVFACGQQAQTTDLNPQALQGYNAKWAQGVGPGYWPTLSSGLVVHLTAGTAWCSGTIVTYASGTLTMTNNTTNYIYLNTSSSCVPAVKTTAFVAADIPIAVVIVASGAITSITDDRTWFVQNSVTSSSVTQYIYVPNCGTTGTSNNHLAKWGNNSVNNSCAVITATTDAGTGIQVPLIGIVVSGAGTTGFAKIAIGGQATCQLDSFAGGVTQGDSLQISSLTAGDCEPIGNTPVAPANENPNTHFIYGLADATAAASSVVTVDITPISPGYGNVGGGSPSLMTVLGSPAYGGTFAMPLNLYQMSSALGADIATGGFFRFSDQQGAAGQYYAKVGSCGGGGGAFNCGLSNHDFVINNHDFGFSNHQQIRFENTTTYSTLDDEGSVSGTVNFYPWNGSTKKYTLTGNTTLVNNTAIAGEQRNPGTIFEFLIVNSGSFSLTVPADWHGFPSAGASTTTVAFCATQSDNSLWCAGSGTGSGTVITTGSPLSGNLAKFSGATSVTNTDLTGDVTTSGGSATTLASVVSASSCGDATHSCGLTYDAKGRITAASNNVITGTGGGSTNTPWVIPVAASPSISYVGLELWLSADCITVTDAGTCSTPTNGTAITIWHDRSGNFHNESQGSGTCTFNTSQINSLPAVTFSSCRLDGFMLPFRAAITVFAVVKNTGASKGGIFSGSVNSSFYYFTGATKEQGVDDANSAAKGSGTAATDASWHQINVTCASNANPAFRIGRAADTTISGGNCSLGQNTTVWSVGYNDAGNTENLSGQLAELLVYRRILSSSEISTVETYLNSRYGL